MGNYSERILYGFSDIRINDKQLLGGISCNVSLEIQKAVMSNRTNSYTISQVSSGNGELTVLGLTMEEKAEIFGLTIENQDNERIIEIGNVQPQTVKLSFKRQKENGKYIKYEMYVIFDLDSIEITTLEDTFENNNTTLNFTVVKNDGVYYKQMENI